MAYICPTVTAYNEAQYREQITRLKSFAEFVHIDLMDGVFAPTTSPELSQIWWPHEMQADIHLMYMRPMDYLKELVRLRPRMVIVHAEADVQHMHFAAELHKHGIAVGLALLQATAAESVERIVHSFDQVLVFSGKLGHHGGVAELALLDKVGYVRDVHPDVEIAWDGGIAADNVADLVCAGVDVLNVGGYIQKSERPDAAYATLLEEITKI